MIKKGEIWGLIILAGLALAGWIVFGIFYDYWIRPRISNQDRTGWLIAAIGLYTGIAASVAFFIYAFVVGARNYQRQRMAKMSKI